ncbi:MAG: leucine-rich repeat domain-containing protein, partial [Ruminococcus sp.]|nr:leucine-rich repeat domain-containing protein [Ruminococcus sp.]
MATLNQNINQAISDFGAIKTAIENKGVTVSSGTPTSQYASKINSIQTGITPSGTINISSNGTVDVTQYASASVSVSGDSTTLANLIKKSITSITVPSQVSQIGPYSFYECRALETVNMSNILQSIDEYAFSYCLSIVNITFPSSLY